MVRAEQASNVGGFLKMTLLDYPFLQMLSKLKKALNGVDNKVEKFEATLNEAAEEACKTAAPIFVNAIKNMSVQDGFAILNGNEMQQLIS